MFNHPPPCAPILTLSHSPHPACAVRVRTLDAAPGACSPHDMSRPVSMSACWLAMDPSNGVHTTSTQVTHYHHHHPDPSYRPACLDIRLISTKKCPLGPGIRRQYDSVLGRRADRPRTDVPCRRSKHLQTRHYRRVEHERRRHDRGWRSTHRGRHDAGHGDRGSSDDESPTYSCPLATTLAKNVGLKGLHFNAQAPWCAWRCGCDSADLLSTNVSSLLWHWPTSRRAVAAC